MGPRQSNAESQKAQGLISRGRYGFWRSVGGDVSRPGSLALGRAGHHGWNVAEPPRFDCGPYDSGENIRIIIARQTTLRERKHYEEQSAEQKTKSRHTSRGRHDQVE